MSRYIQTLGQADDFVGPPPPPNGGSPATSTEIKAEAEEMSTAQKIKATEEIVAASGDLMKEAGPALAMGMQIFTTTISAAPQMLTPALQTLLALPLPQPLKNSIKGIIQNAKQEAPGPGPKTPPPPDSEALAAARRRKMIPWIVGGFGVLSLGAIVFFNVRKKRSR